MGRKSKFSTESPIVVLNGMFFWNNYIRITGFKENEIDIKLKERDDDTTIEEAFVAEYIPFIRFLYDRREKVYQMLDGVREDGMIPRYAIPGYSRRIAWIEISLNLINHKNLNRLILLYPKIKKPMKIEVLFRIFIVFVYP